MNVIYDTATGRILRVTTAAGQALSGEGELEGCGTLACTATHYVSGGEMIPFPERPSAFHEWDWGGMAWAPNLEAARERVRSTWNKHREAQLSAGVLFDGAIYHADDRFMGELQMLVTGFAKGVITEPVAIRRKDNVTVMMSAAQIEALMLTAGIYRQQVYAASWTAKDQLAGKATIEEILALLPQ